MLGWLTGGFAMLAALPILLLTVLLGGTGGAAVGLGPSVPDRYAGSILAAANACTPPLPANVLAAQLHQESGWNPAAVSPAGAVGLAQFLPGTWTIWATDGNGDGLTDPRNPFDAIAAQGRFMCALMTQFADIRLALAAYNAGPAAVQRYGGIPPYPETEQYVQSVMATAASPGFAVVYAAAPYSGQPVDALMPAGRSNPRDAEAAVRWALAQVGTTVLPDGTPQARHCLRLVTLAYGYTAGKHYAYQVWTDAPASIRHPGDRNPPRGAVLVWDPRSGDGAGHIAIALGDGQMVTTTGTTVQVLPIDGYADMAHYYGWMPPLIT